MNSLDALRRMVAGYPGGRPAMAVRLNKSDEVLRKELSGSSAHHKMGLADAEEIATMCREAGSPDAHALGAIFSFHAGMLALPAASAGAGPRCLTRAAATAVHEVADVLVAIAQSKADGNISDNDRAYVLREMGQTLAAMQEVYAALEAEHAADNARSAQ